MPALLAALDAFLHEHRRCGDLDAGLDGERVPARRLAVNGLKAWRPVLDRGYEGLVAKDESSPYRSGRTLSWLKVGPLDHRVAERGWSQPSNSRG